MQNSPPPGGYGGGYRQGPPVQARAYADVPIAPAPTVYDPTRYDPAHAGVSYGSDAPRRARQALTVAIVAFFLFGFVLGPVAIWMGTSAKKEIDQNPAIGGRGQAIAAIIIGAIAAVWNVLMYALIITAR